MITNGLFLLCIHLKLTVQYLKIIGQFVMRLMKQLARVLLFQLLLIMGLPKLVDTSHLVFHGTVMFSGSFLSYDWTGDWRAVSGHWINRQWYPSWLTRPIHNGKCNFEQSMERQPVPIKCPLLPAGRLSEGDKVLVLFWGCWHCFDHWLPLIQAEQKTADFWKDQKWPKDWSNPSHEEEFLPNHPMAGKAFNIWMEEQWLQHLLAHLEISIAQYNSDLGYKKVTRMRSFLLICCCSSIAFT